MKSNKNVLLNIDNELLNEIEFLIEESHSKVEKYVNATLNTLFWHVGFKINQFVLLNERAGYGKQIVVTLSRLLLAKYWTGFPEKKEFETQL